MMREGKGKRLKGVELLVVVFLSGCGLFGGKGDGGGATLSRTGSVEGRVVLPSRQAGGFEGFLALVQDTDVIAPVGPDGTFKLEGVPVGEQTISIVSESGELGAHIVAIVEPGKVTDVGEVRPVATGMIAGIVSGATSGGDLRPVAGARVVARPILSAEERLSDLANGRPFLVAKTNARGEYVIRAVPPGRYLLEARHPHYLPATKEVTVEERSTANGDLVMKPRPGGGAVYGRVVAKAEGKEPSPVPGALVALIPQVPEGIGPPPPPPVLQPLEAKVGEITSGEGVARGQGLAQRPWGRPLFAFTGSDGTYRIDGVPPGKYTAVAFKAGYRSEPKEVEVEEGEEVKVEFILKVEVGVVAGVVRRAGSGEPIEGARVWAFSVFDPFVLWEGLGIKERIRPKGALPVPPMRMGAVTDKEGRYSLKVRPGRYVVVAWARGFKRSFREIEVEAGKEVEANFSLMPLGAPLPPPAGLRLVLKVEGRNFPIGEPIKIELKLKNASKEPVTITFPTSQRFDLVVSDTEGKEVWRWSHGKVFLQVIQEVTLEPGEELEFKATWDQRDNEGRQVPSGAYVMVGELTGEPKVVSRPIRFTIGGSKRRSLPLEGARLEG